MAEKQVSVEVSVDINFGTFYLHAGDAEMRDIVLGRLAASSGPWVALTSHVPTHTVGVRLEVWDAEPVLDQSWAEWEHALLEMQDSRTVAISDFDATVLELPLEAPAERYWLRALARRHPATAPVDPSRLGSSDLETWLLQLWPAEIAASVIDAAPSRLLPIPEPELEPTEARVEAGMRSVRASGWLEYLDGDITYNLGFAFGREERPFGRAELEHGLAYNDVNGSLPLTPEDTQSRPLQRKLPESAQESDHEKQERWHQLAAAYGLPRLQTIADGVDFLLTVGVLIEDDDGIWPNPATPSLLHSGLLSAEGEYVVEYRLLRKQVPQLRDELVALLTSLEGKTWTGPLASLSARLSATPEDVRKAARLGGKFARSGEAKITFLERDDALGGEVTVALQSDLKSGA